MFPAFKWRELMMKYLWIGLSAALVLLPFGCGSDESTEDAQCNVGQTYNPISGECEDMIRVQPDMGNNNTNPNNLNNQNNTNNLNNTNNMVDMGQDMPDFSCMADNDNDGHIALECGGDDCNDLEDAINPGQNEICDTLDNDCNDAVNDGIVCAFYAQSDEKLYLIDPFAKNIAELGDVPGLFDMDTNIDGTLYGLTVDYLYRFDDVAMTWSQLPQPLGINIGTANGMAIDSEGNVWITSGNVLFSADLTTGRATEIGSMGGTFDSSGDCVVTKSDALYMTSGHTPTDSLVFIDGTTGNGSFVGVTGFDSIWALTSAWNKLYGLTASGELIEIDRGSGQGTLLHRFDGYSFYGAASTPGR